jgi:hypothetical protein
MTMSRKRLTVERTERVTLEHDDTAPIIHHDAGDTAPLAWAPGWDARHPAAFYREQRAGQVERCADFLALWDVSAAPGTPVPDRLIAEAAIILRAGPNATPLELYLGRTV